jgi:hypothetical protein
MALLELRPVPEIEAFFDGIGLRVSVHTSPEPEPSADEVRRMSSEVRRAGRDRPQPTHWADLVSTKTGRVSLRWYSSGTDAEDALRNAAFRWRYEQSGPQPSPPNETPSA